MGRAAGKELEGSMRMLDCGENLGGNADSDLILHDSGDDIDPDCEVTSTVRIGET